MSAVVLEGVTKRFGRVEAIRRLDLAVDARELLVLLGPSGCGKSTILNIVAGLERPTSGRVRIGGEDATELEPQARDVAMVFQSYALYPHKTVYGNLAFPLRLRRMGSDVIEARVGDVARRLGLAELLDRKPAELSGGQRQRVALGRALVRRPRLFLLDEPLSNLDAQLRVEMRAELRRLHREFETTTIYVTHDQVEAMSLADRIAVLDRGALQQVGTPMEIYRRPANLFVARFVGNPGMNVLEARLVGDRLRLVGGVELELGARRASELAGRTGAGGALLVGVRPEDVRLGSAEPGRARIELVELLGPDALVVLDAEGSRLVARTGPDRAGSAGETVRFGLDAGRLSLFEPATGRRIELDEEAPDAPLRR